MDYARYEPKLDHAFQAAVKDGAVALQKLYQSPVWQQFTDHYTSVVIKDLTLQNMHLHNLDIHDVIMDHARFDHVQFTNISLISAESWQATFKKCHFDHCPNPTPDMIYGDTNYIDVRKSSWENVTFKDMSLRYWLLNGGTFKDIQVHNVDLPITQNELVHFLKSRQFDEFNKRRYEQAPEISELDLTHTNLSDIDFHGFQFAYIDARFANLQNANFAGEGLFVNDFSGADMRGADLRGCHSTSRFYGADLRGAKFDHFIAHQKDWTPSRFYGAKLDPQAHQIILNTSDEAFAKPTYDYHTTSPQLPAWNGF